MTGSHLLLGLAPSGVYLATYVAISTGELLPHRFTLTVSLARPGGLFSVALSVTTFVAPRLASGILPYGVRTFLMACTMRMRVF